MEGARADYHHGPAIYWALGIEVAHQCFGSSGSSQALLGISLLLASPERRRRHEAICNLCLAWPAARFLILCFMNGAIWNAGSGLVLIFVLVLLGPAIYSVGPAPALLCGIIDVFLERLPIYQRLALIGAAGYLLSYLPIRGSKIPLTVEAVAYGLTGLVAAVVCSWLTSERQIQRASVDNRTEPPSGAD